MQRPLSSYSVKTVGAPSAGLSIERRFRGLLHWLHFSGGSFFPHFYGKSVFMTQTYWLLLDRALMSGNSEVRQAVTSGALSWAQVRQRRQGKDDSGFLLDTFWWKGLSVCRVSAFICSGIIEHIITQSRNENQALVMDTILTSSFSCLLQNSIMGFRAPLADQSILKAAL